MINFMGKESLPVGQIDKKESPAPVREPIDYELALQKKELTIDSLYNPENEQRLRE